MKTSRALYLAREALKRKLAAGILVLRGDADQLASLAEDLATTAEQIEQLGICVAEAEASEAAGND